MKPLSKVSSVDNGKSFQFEKPKTENYFCIKFRVVVSLFQRRSHCWRGDDDEVDNDDDEDVPTIRHDLFMFLHFVSATIIDIVDNSKQKEKKIGNFRTSPFRKSRMQSHPL